VAALRELAIELGIEVDEDAVEDAEKSLQEFQANIGKYALAAVAALGTAAVGLAEFGRETAVAIEQGSRQLGISRQEFQQWEAVARSAGAEGEKIIDVMANLQEKAQGVALDPHGEMAKTFQRLGIAARDANGQIRTGPQLMRDAADALARMGPGTEQTATAMQLFGDAGRELLPVLGQGSAAIDRVIADFERLGGGLDDEAIESSLEFNKALLTLKSTLMGALSPVLKAINPILSQVATWFTEAAAKMRAFAERSTALRTTLIALITGGIGALAFAIDAALPVIAAWVIAWAPFIAGTIGVTAAVAAFSLVIDDLITFLEGGDSALGAFLDTIGGAGTAERVLEKIREKFDKVERAIENMKRAASGIADKIGLGIDAVDNFASNAQTKIGPLATLFNGVRIAVDALLGPLGKAADLINQIAAFPVELISGALDLAAGDEVGSTGAGGPRIATDENGVPRVSGGDYANDVIRQAQANVRQTVSAPLAPGAQARTTTVNGSHSTQINIGGVVDTRILTAEVNRIMREAQESMANDLADGVQGS
jgi:hypothetical protein